MPITIADEQNRAKEEGVQREENYPFLLTPPNPSGTGVLLVHGFGATPREMRLIAEDLADAGMTAFAVRLSGHGTSPEDLATRKWEDWYHSVERGFSLLEGCNQVFGVGLSTGSILLLALAARKRMDGLVLLSPFLRLRHPLAPAVGLLKSVRKWQATPTPENLLHFYYQRRPLSGIHQIQKLVHSVEKMLPQITTPALLIGAEGDRTVRIESQLPLFHRLGSGHREYHLFGPDVPHGLTREMNPRLEETMRLCRDFLLSLRRQASRKGP